MVVASGQMPYEYDVALPLTASSVTGPSGVHLESAQFVLNAEIRKFDLFSNFFTTRWESFDHPINAAIAYEPRADGSTLAGDVTGPVQMDLDQIPRMRGVMIEGLFERYEDFSPYDSDVIAQDWIQQAYPSSPSGYSEVTLAMFLRPVLQADGSTYFPTVLSGDAVIGTFTDPDIHWLGGSGVILDIDVGEVMFNPYPVAVNLGNGNAHNFRTDRWNVQIRPFWPAFQKTNSSLITLNGFEQRWPEWLSETNLLNQTDHVGSGNVLFVGYPILSATDYILGRMNDPAGDVHGLSNSADEFTHVSDSVGSLGVSVNNLEHSAVFLDPPVLPTGVYRTAMRNTKSNFPFTAVESGVISQWPEPRDIASNFNNYFGYEVFDSCFWVTDAGNNSSTGGAASGLSVISPFTGSALWVRNSTHVSLGNYHNGASVVPAYWDIGIASLQRIGTNDIKRICRTPNATVGVGGGDMDVDIDVGTFNDTISTVATTTVTVTIPTIAVGSIGDIRIWHMVFDGTSHHIIIKDDNGIEPQVVVTLDSGFVQSSIAIFGSTSDRITRLGYISDGLGGSQSLVTFLDTNNTFLADASQLGIRPITLGNPPTFGTEKAIDTTTVIAGTLTDAELLDLLEISGETEVDDGVYALFRVDTSTTANTLYIARIEEDTTTWLIKGLWKIATFSSSYNPFGGDMGMIYMDVN